MRFVGGVETPGAPAAWALRAREVVLATGSSGEQELGGGVLDQLLLPFTSTEEVAWPRWAFHPQACPRALAHARSVVPLWDVFVFGLFRNRAPAEKGMTK